jgi:cation diffusion facilitator family transporter
MPDEAGKFQNINLALMATNVAIVLYAVPLVDIARGKKSGAAAKAQLVALLEMEVAFVATLIAAILVAQGYYLADPFASIFVGSVVVLSGLYLLRDNVDYLLGRAPSRKFVELVESTAKSVEGVLDIRDRKAWYVGPNIVHTGFHIEVAKGTPIEEADRIAEAVNERVGRKTGCQHRVIHVDPARKSPSRNRRRSGEKPDSRRAAGGLLQKLGRP